MKYRHVIAIAFAIALASLASAQGFRGIPWGSSKAYVMAHETANLMHEGNTEVLFDVTVNGLSGAAFYDFVPGSGELARAGYIFIPKHTNDNLYIQDYNGFKSIITSKYGTPDEDETKWNSDLMKGDPSHYGLAVATGDLIYYSSWTVDDADIKLMLRGDNYEVSLSVFYESHAYFGKLEDAQQAQKGNAF